MSSNDNIRDGFDELLGGINKELEAKKTPSGAPENKAAADDEEIFLDIDSFEDAKDEDMTISISSKAPTSEKATSKKPEEAKPKNDGAPAEGTRVFDTVNPQKKAAEKEPAAKKASATSEKKQIKTATNTSKAKTSGAPSAQKPQSKLQGILSGEKNKKPTQVRKVEASSSTPKSNNPEKTSDTKSSKNRKKNKGLLGGVARFVIYICFIAVASIVCSSIIISVTNDMFAFNKDTEIVTIEIPEGASSKEVSKILSKNDIISNPTVFKFYTDFKKGKSTYYTDGFKSGSFELSPSMNYDDLIYALSNNIGSREVVRLTFPEGCTIDEIIDILIAGGVQNTREEYIDVIQNFDYDYRFINELDTENFKTGRKYRLEGYLFPDTYDFYTDASAVDVINKFLVNFNNKFDTTFYDAAQSHGLTVDEIINIASLVEKEAGKAEDFGAVSSVFHNRIKNSATYPYLQSDATIQYAFPERKTSITPEDLKYDSPYNTYIYAGLSPSAVANPGLDAITAALYPDDTSYFYFISNGRGEIYYAKTLDGHNANIAMIRQESGN